jgi:ribulose-5-phosphate 4-epimerase/fuculose-1-phosphate aldolase
MGVNEAGFVIHSCVHKARHEINCVIHTHTRAGVAVSAMKCGLLPISQHAMMIQADVAYHDYEGIALYREEQARMAADLGKSAKAMILRNHGLSRSARPVREAFEVMYYLDCACQIQIDACSAACTTCSSCRRLPRAPRRKQFKPTPNRPAHHKDWPALLRMLERRGVRYAE